MHLENNLTFAVLTSNTPWKTDFTLRFCEYFSHQINGENFMKNIIFPATIDSAIAECKTDYLLIQNGGHVTFSPDFFIVLEQAAEEATDLFIGNLKIENDYVVLKQDCLFINKKIWLECGRPRFSSKIHEGPNFEITAEIQNQDKYHPGQITAVGDERVFITGECSLNGAELIVKQLDLAGVAVSFAAVVDPSSMFYLDSATPYKEVFAETYFEKKYLKPNLEKIETRYSQELDLPEIQPHLLICCGRGLRNHSLIETLKPSKVIVFDNNPNALAFQKMILGITEPKLYKEIVADFLTENPYADLLSLDNQDVAVRPINATLEYKCVDAFSYELEDLLRNVDHSCSMVLDLGDTFVYPYSFYKKPFYQIQSLFTEVYSVVKSRTGATYVIGFAPGFQQMNELDINTSPLQYDERAAVVIETPVEGEDSPELTQEMIDFIEEKEKTSYARQVITPLTDSTEFKRPDSSNVAHSTKPTFKWATKKEDIAPVQQHEEVGIAEPHLDLLDKWMHDQLIQFMNFDERREEIQEVVEKVVVQNCEFADGINAAIEIGYSMTMTDEIYTLTKEEVFEEFTALFQYKIDVPGSLWGFSVSKVDGDKAVQFSTGVTNESLLKHLDQKIKINPKTAIKYL